MIKTETINNSIEPENCLDQVFSSSSSTQYNVQATTQLQLQLYLSSSNPQDETEKINSFTPLFQTLQGMGTQQYTLEMHRNARRLNQSNEGPKGKRPKHPM